MIIMIIMIIMINEKNITNSQMYKQMGKEEKRKNSLLTNKLLAVVKDFVTLQMLNKVQIKPYVTLVPQQKFDIIENA